MQRKFWGFITFGIFVVCGFSVFANAPNGIASGDWVNKHFMDFDDVRLLPYGWSGPDDDIGTPMAVSAVEFTTVNGEKKSVLRGFAIDENSIHVSSDNELIADIIARVLYYDSGGTQLTGNNANNWNTAYPTAAASGTVVSAMKIERNTHGERELKVKFDNIKVPVGSATATNNYAQIWVQD